MTSGQSKDLPAPPARNVVKVLLRDKNELVDDATARELTRPSVQAAATIQRWQGDNHEVNALSKELAGQIAAVNGGDLSRAEAMLLAQAHTLDELFNSLARRAHLNLGEYINAAETYLRLALKAQSQCRATLETLAAIKNPPVVYARQANIANGPQQVNNGPPSRTEEKEIEQSKLSEAKIELLPNASAPKTAGQANSQLETVGALYGTQNAKG